MQTGYVACGKRLMTRRRLILTVAGLAFVVSAGVFFLRDRDRRLKEALARSVQAALDERDLAKAKRLIDGWAAQRPGDGAADYYRAELAVRRDDPVAAMDAIRRALQHGYPERPIEVLRAVLLARAGKFDEAEPLLRRARAEPGGPRPEIAEALARVYLGTFRLAEASKALDWWAELAPQDPRPHLWRNQIDERVSADPGDLARNYHAALQRDPDLDQARLGLADALRKARRLSEADAEYAIYLGRNPTSVDGHVGAGEVAMLRGDLSAATRHFREALALDARNPVALRELGLIHIRNGRYSQARDFLETAVEVAPDDTEVRYNYALALKLAGDDALAAEETLATDRLRAEQQRIADLRKALNQNPDDDDLRAEVAKWLIDRGHEKEGLGWTELILRKKPGHPPTCRLLAEYYTKKGNAGLANYYRLAASPGAEKPPR